MQLLTLADYPDYKPDIEFKSPVLPRLIAMVVTIVLGIALLVAPHFPVHGFRIPLWWSYPAAAFIALMRMLSLSVFRKSLRPTNWLLRSSGNRVWIKFRSFMNDHLPDDGPQVIQLDQSDIAWIRRVKIKAIYLSGGGNTGQERTRQTLRYLDIGLNRIDTCELGDCLRKEEQHPGDLSRRVRSKFNHSPVSVPEAGVIRLLWSDHYDRITPGVGQAVDFFARRTRTLAGLEFTVDYTPGALSLMPDNEQSARLRELKRIDQMAATRAARMLKKCSTGEAMEYLETV